MGGVSWARVGFTHAAGGALALARPMPAHSVSATSYTHAGLPGTCDEGGCGRYASSDTRGMHCAWTHTLHEETCAARSEVLLAAHQCGIVRPQPLRFERSWREAEAFTPASEPRVMG